MSEITIKLLETKQWIDNVLRIVKDSLENHDEICSVWIDIGHSSHSSNNFSMKIEMGHEIECEYTKLIEFYSKFETNDEKLLKLKLYFEHMGYTIYYSNETVQDIINPEIYDHFFQHNHMLAIIDEILI